MEKTSERVPGLDPARNIGLAESLRRLAELVPSTYPEWKRLLDKSVCAYAGFPTDSCSVAGHDHAAAFAEVVQPLLRGKVLDIGCGPQPTPLYLEAYPPEMLYGIDPLSAPEDHPFYFVPGVAEFLPWRDDFFSVVIAATSLDHLLIPAVAYAEIARVLVPGGHFLVWEGFVPAAKRYDPHAESGGPVDQYHLFHYTRPDFEADTGLLFGIVAGPPAIMATGSAFYVLKVRHRSG